MNGRSAACTGAPHACDIHGRSITGTQLTVHRMNSFNLGDMQRLFLGEGGWGFLLEVILRSSLTYVSVLAVMRLLGARVSGQFTLFETSVVIVVAAAIGVPLQSGDRGILPAVVLVLVMVGMQRLAAEVGLKKRRVQTAISGDISLLAQDGMLMLDSMARNTVARETLYAQLRTAGHLQLGEVQSVYFEPSGKLTIVPARPTRPGLCLVPAFDEALIQLMREDGYVCGSCGKPLDATAACPRCKAGMPKPAVMAPED
jgi:uncharacterized membrane protein YcaP (DUF421 family)